MEGSEKGREREWRGARKEGSESGREREWKGARMEGSKKVKLLTLGDIPRNASQEDFAAVGWCLVPSRW